MSNENEARNWNSRRFNLKQMFWQKHDILSDRDIFTWLLLSHKTSKHFQLSSSKETSFSTQSPLQTAHPRTAHTPFTDRLMYIAHKTGKQFLHLARSKVLAGLMQPPGEKVHRCVFIILSGNKVVCNESFWEGINHWVCQVMA